MNADPRVAGLLISAALHLSMVSAVWLGSRPSGGGILIERPVAVSLTMFDATSAESESPLSNDGEAAETTIAEPLGATPASDDEPSPLDVPPPSAVAAPVPIEEEPLPAASIALPTPKADPSPSQTKPPEPARPATTASHERRSTKTLESGRKVERSSVSASTPRPHARPPLASTSRPEPLIPTAGDGREPMPMVRSPGTAAQRDSYLAELSARIDAYKRYPRKARRRGEEGTVVIRVVIERDGRFSDLQIAASSGSERLDGAALAALHKTSPFRPIPTSLGRSSWAIDVPIVFNLRR